MDSTRQWLSEQEFQAMRREMDDLQKRVNRLERELEWAMRGPKSETVSHLPAAPMSIDEDDGA